MVAIICNVGLIKQAQSFALDHYGALLNCPRKKWWVFKEWDKVYKYRLIKHLKSNSVPYN